MSKYVYKAQTWEKKYLKEVSGNTLDELVGKLEKLGVEVIPSSLKQKFAINHGPFDFCGVEISKTKGGEPVKSNSSELGLWLKTCGISVAEIAKHVPISENTLYRAKMGPNGGGTTLSKIKTKILLPYALANGFKEVG